MWDEWMMVAHDSQLTCNNEKATKSRKVAMRLENKSSTSASPIVYCVRRGCVVKWLCAVRVCERLCDAVLLFVVYRWSEAYKTHWRPIHNKSHACSSTLYICVYSERGTLAHLLLFASHILSARVADIIITISAWARQKMVFKYPLYPLASLLFSYLLEYIYICI